MNQSEISTSASNMHKENEKPDWSTESVADLDSCEGSEPSDIDEPVEETPAKYAFALPSVPRTTTTTKSTSAATVTAPAVTSRTPDRSGKGKPRAPERKRTPYHDSAEPCVTVTQRSLGDDSLSMYKSKKQHDVPSSVSKERTYTFAEVAEIRRTIMAEAATTATTKKRVGTTHISHGWAENSNWREDLLVLTFGRFNCKPNVWEDETTVPQQLRDAATTLQGQLTEASTNGTLGQGVPVTLSSKYAEDLLWVIDQATAGLPNNITLEKFELEKCGVRWRTELKSKSTYTRQGGRGWTKNGHGARTAPPSQ